jgi:hypothetical protein
MNPDDLLQQIVQLAQQFVGNGGDPAMLQDALTQATAGGPSAGDQQGAPPPDAGGGPPPDAAIAAMMGGQGGGGPQDYSNMAPDGGVPAGSSIGDAANMAIQDLKKRRTKG